jgi:predicted  nucleic acid-binding Zn-ribbon protein
VVRTCEKCGKVNQPTRKFCIRCGASLLKAPKPEPDKAPLPTAEAQQKSRVIVSEDTPGVKPAEEPKSTAQDKWVKPSEVAKDRVRHTEGSGRAKSELEKAKEAFARAETVGIDEEGTGVIETRMLRASEVKELLEGPGLMEGSEDVPPPQMMPGSEPLPPEAAEMMKPAAPTASQIEKQILGKKSGFVEPEPEPEPEPPVLEATTVDEEGVAAEAATGFSSAKSEDATAVEAPQASSPKTVAAAVEEADDSLDLVIACPSCGHVLNIDMFDYPNEVYSAMGDARLKQARYFILQGKNADAKRVTDVARALYDKAADKKGLAEAKKLADSLVKKS